MNVNQHFKKIDEGVKACYVVAEKARALGFDPIMRVETQIASSLAEKSVGLVSLVYPQLQDPQLIDYIFELEKKYGQLDPAVAFRIAEEIARERFCKFESLLQAMDAGIRTGFAYITLGVVSSPIEGFTDLKTGRTRDGKEYIKAYFSGPIRSAGTTAGCVVLMIIDYLRELFGFAKFDPDEQEVKRYVTENYDYHERVTNLQYLPTEAEIMFLAHSLPIEITGEPTEQREVSNYKDLPRLETNFIRGGMCLIFSEGLAQKANKGLRLLRSVQAKGFTASGWDFLDAYVTLHEKREKGKSDSSPIYIRDLVAGRPVLGHPSRSGGFRFRYGRSRTGGFSATSVHPATMAISGGFLSSGTQLKIEKPTKGCAISVCDSIDGPIVKLRNGSVRKIDDFAEAKRLYSEVEEIVYFGDLLFPLEDVINRNFELLKPGYVEEWWGLALEKASKVKIEVNAFSVEFEDALRLSAAYDMPLHPAYIFYWSQISHEEFLSLLDWLAHAEITSGKIIFSYTKNDKERFVKGKRALELIGCEHEVTIEHVVVNENDTRALLFNLGLDVGKLDQDRFVHQFEETIKRVKELRPRAVLELINSLCKFTVKDKAGTFIGARMGRPEKAKLRKLTGSPNVLFPVGAEGGRLRSFQSALDAGCVHAEFPRFYCAHCEHETIYLMCELCGEFCKKIADGGLDYSRRRIVIRGYFEHAKKLARVKGEEIPLVKGVRGTSNEDHSIEFLAKGLLRAKYGLAVNKDGTIRYDMTEMALTHFKPREIGTSVEKLRALGYLKDTSGKTLQSEDQILQLFPHDIILPACPESLDEKADDVFFKIAQFVDEELERIYGMEKFYCFIKKNDLIGHLVVCIAPHICTATVGRIVGFSKIQALLASPYLHAAMRRDCDGDECAAMLLMDLLLNFSRKFLPAHRGGTQDSPLVLNTRIRAGEVDDQILDFILGKYSLEMYELAEQSKHSSKVKVENVKTRLQEGNDPFSEVHYTHECSDFNAGVVNSSYKTLATMREKVEAQMELCRKLRAVDTRDVARLVIERHFIRDIRGNLRKFSMQGFRCVMCNEKYRRPPLVGKCTKCGGKLLFTISEGSIVKYMQPALDLARKFGASPYLLESLELTEMYIQSIFGREKEKQETIGKWF